MILEILRLVHIIDPYDRFLGEKMKMEGIITLLVTLGEEYKQLIQ